MKSAVKNIQLASYDDLFKTDEERLSDTQERVQSLPLDRLMPFPNHPFKVLDDEKMQETVESIKERGVLVPILVRPTNDGNFEIVSGHRRHHASLLAGKTEIPAIVREMDDDTAILLMVDSNLQREELLPSEKAFAYKMKLDAMKRQGQRTDLTCARIAHKSDVIKSRDILAEQVGESKDQIRRYIRLTNLVPELLEYVDEGRIKMRPAVELSYLDEDSQRDVVEQIDINDCTPSHDQTIRMRKMFESGKLTAEAVEAIMSEEKPNQRERIVLRSDRVRSLIPKNVQLKDTEDYVCKALEHYAKYLRHRSERDSR